MSILFGSYIVYWDHQNERNIVLQYLPVWVMTNCMVSITTHFVVLKRGVPTKYSYISAATHPITLNLVIHEFIYIALLPDGVVFKFSNLCCHKY